MATAAVITGSVGHRRQNEGCDDTDTLEMVAVFHQSGGQERQRQVSLGINGETGRSRAEPTKSPGRIHDTEQARQIALATQKESRTDVGGIGQPVAGAAPHVEQDVALVSRLVMSAEIDHTG